MYNAFLHEQIHFKANVMVYIHPICHVMILTNLTCGKEKHMLQETIGTGAGASLFVVNTTSGGWTFCEFVDFQLFLKF